MGLRIKNLVVCKHYPYELLASILLLSITLACFGKEKTEYLIDVWTLEDGLPNSSVTAITQTQDGYLWIGTYNGLARFDGVRFVTFDPANTPALGHARIRRLYVDSSGTLWINTYDGSLTAYKNRKFELEYKGDGGLDATAIFLGEDNGQPVFLLYSGEIIRRIGPSKWQRIIPPASGSRVLAAIESGRRIWYRGTNHSLWWIEGSEIKPAPRLPIKGERINALVKGQGQQIWIGTDKEFGVWENGSFTVLTPTNGEPELNVTYLKPTADGVWVIANGRVRKASAKEWIYEAEPCRNVFTGSVDRLGIVQDQRSGTWIYHYGRGLFHIRSDGVCRKLELEENFPGERVDSFFCDREGNVWAGVDRGGLVRIRERVFEVLAPGTSPAHRAVVTVAEDSSGNIWVGTYGAGLYKLTGNKWENIPLPWGERGNFVFSICPTGNDSLWLSAGEEDLVLLKNLVPAFQSSWPHGVKTILAARNGCIWIGTKNELICWSNGIFKSYRTEQGVKRIDFRALAEDPDGNIWAGTGDGTLYKIEAEKVHSLIPPDNINAPIWSLYIDDQAVWAGTFRGGLLIYHKGRFTRVTKQHGLPSDVIAQILEDTHGNLWFGSHQGIFRASKSQLLALAEGQNYQVQCTSYGRYDGLPSLECSGGYQPAACRTSSGKLLFSTRNGLVCVDPSRLLNNRTPPPIVIELVKADGIELELQTHREENPLLRIPTEKTFSVNIPPGTRQIEFYYTGLSLVSPDRVQFKYRLVGLHQQWVEAGTRRIAQYSYVKPGKYRFEVTACNNEGVWNPSPTVLLVNVQPRFYQTTWFLAITTTTLVASIATLARHFSIRKMRKKLEQAQRQHELERDRRRIANDIHDELGAGLTHIMLLSELGRRSPPDQANEFLSQISQKARELTRAMDEIVWAVSPQNDTLESLLSYLTKFAMDYLGSAGIRCRIDAPVQVPLHSADAETRHNLYLAVKEALTNIIKHAQATEVHITFEITNESFHIRIQDNGKGLGSSPPPSDGRIQTGHGISSMHSRIKECGGQFHIQSQPGGGTTVIFSIPINKNLST